MIPQRKCKIYILHIFMVLEGGEKKEFRFRTYFSQRVNSNEV